MNDGDLELRLGAGKPIPIDNVGEMIFPSVGEIIDLGKSYYDQIIGSLLFNKDQVGENEEFTDLSNFQVFYLYYYKLDDFRKIVFNGLSLLFREEPKISENVLGIYFGDLNDGRMITENNFEEFQDIIAKANMIKIEKNKEEEFKPFDDRAQAIIDMIKKGRKERPKPKEDVNLNSVIQGLSWRSNGMNIKEIYNLTIYQVYMGYFYSQNIDANYFTMTGIYTGNIDAKNINMSELNWAKILDKT